MRLDRFTAAVFLQLAIVCSTVAAQPRTAAQGRVDFSVATVRLGSSYSRVKAHLGRPASDTTHRDDSLGAVEIVRTLKYSGLVVRLHKTRRVFRVVSIDVTSSDWLVAPGLRVGLDAKQVVARIGVPYEESDQGSRHRYHYLNRRGDGFALLEFENNRVVALRWSYDLT